MDLDGRVAVITGGASGIGLATAKRLKARGATLVLADIEAAPLERAAVELGALGVITDVSSKASVDALADQTYATFGRADIVFNNAGVAASGPIVEMTHSDWEWQMAVNLWGPIHGVEAFVPRMAAAAGGGHHGRSHGHVLFTASFAGLAPNVGLGPYCVTKYGVVAMAEVLHKELRTNGIGVSVLCPMRVATNISTSERNRPAEFGGPDSAHGVPDQDESNPDLAGRVLPVEVVAAAVDDAIFTERLYVLPHDESRSMIQRRFARIESAFAGTDR